MSIDITLEQLETLTNRSNIIKRNVFRQCKFGKLNHELTVGDIQIVLEAITKQNIGDGFTIGEMEINN